MKTCEIAGCGKPRVARGWCGPHYKRWWRHGDPLAGGTRYATPAARFDADTRREGECLVWVGDRYDDGYGRIAVGGRQVVAHRYSWERERGVLGPGVMLDHRCHNKACVEVEHLRIATSSQNNAHLAGARSTSTTGVRNVYRHGRRFRVLVQSRGVRYGGLRDTLEEAAEWAAELRAQVFGPFAGKG